METKLLISYGSTMNQEFMAKRCPGAKVTAKSWLHDYRLVFQGIKYPHASVIPEKGQSVPVLLWHITPQDEANLDEYNGTEYGFYTKEYLPVEYDGEIVNALTYIMSPRALGVPYDFYLEIIARAYKDLNFPINILNNAVKYSKFFKKEEQENAG
jgi:gamma-glutamylcyclotransferase (GGCT)/AIG2-like uncharacterized protein YtfP